MNRKSFVGTLAVLLAAAGLAFGDQPSSEPTRRSEAVSPSAPAGGAEIRTVEQAKRLSATEVQSDRIDEKHRAAAQKLINSGISFLLRRREPDGGWSLGRGANKPAITAMVLKALLQHPDFDRRSPEVRRGFKVMLRYRQKDGGIYDPNQGMANYTTALAVVAMVSANDPNFREETRQAVAFLRSQQITAGSESPDGEEIGKNHPFTGGVSYGRHGRPDLSNVGMWMQALHDADVSPGEPAIQRALDFVTRTQNRSASNPLAWAKVSGNDGGFIYAPSIGGDSTTGESKAGLGPHGRGLRSYGSMTYVGFKSMLYAGLTKDDPRVRAAYDWIRRHWRLDSNPNMPQLQSTQGLYYYYHVFAKTLRAWSEPVITDAKGLEHNWRQELIDVLADRVAADGSWVNDAARWEESNPVLCTAYAVLALQESLKK